MTAESDSHAAIRTSIAGIPIGNLVRQFGTPTYVYDEQTILRRIADLRSFDVIRYAQKACSNLAILDLMRQQQVLVDTVSAGEIQRAMLPAIYPTRIPLRSSIRLTFLTRRLSIWLLSTAFT